MLPAALLARLVRDAWDPLEVKVVLLAAMLGANEVPVAESDILSHEAFVKGARSDGSGRDARERGAEALELATARGTLLWLAGEDGSHWLMLGTEPNRRRVRAGVVVPKRENGSGTLVLRPERPGIFALYEQNIGLVTPILADRLVEALERYPEAWVADAISEAVGYNKRNWRYIQRILETWSTEGRSNETHRGAVARDLDRDKHLRGKYAEVFRRDRD
jgi:DnaD/phage-associated family protein